MVIKMEEKKVGMGVSVEEEGGMNGDPCWIQTGVP
jgi:hypothetical protein